jgi:hypothetical protein
MQMSLRKRLIPLAVMAAVAAIPASAQAGVMGPVACVLTPMGVNGSSNFQGIQTDYPNGLLDTDTGAPFGPPHFTFSGTATCAGVNVAGPAVIPPGTYNISASGEFADLVCETGTASGTANINNGTGVNSVNINTTFDLVFVGGVGELSIAVTGGTVGAANGGTVNSGSGVGVVDILPNATDPFGSDCIGNVRNFFVNGGFAAVLGG